jgi:hypothetical protein
MSANLSRELIYLVWLTFISAICLVNGRVGGSTSEETDDDSELPINFFRTAIESFSESAGPLSGVR